MAWWLRGSTILLPQTLADAIENRYTPYPSPSLWMASEGRFYLFSVWLIWTGSRKVSLTSYESLLALNVFSQASTADKHAAKACPHFSAANARQHAGATAACWSTDTLPIGAQFVRFERDLSAHDQSLLQRVRGERGPHHGTRPTASASCESVPARTLQVQPPWRTRSTLSKSTRASSACDGFVRLRLTHTRIQLARFGYLQRRGPRYAGDGGSV